MSPADPPSALESEYLVPERLNLRRSSRSVRQIPASSGGAASAAAVVVVSGAAVVAGVAVVAIAMVVSSGAEVVDEVASKPPPPHAVARTSHKAVAGERRFTHQS
jgi:hypothetical protein